MKIDIDNLNEQELIELNYKIVERLKFLQSMRAHKNMMEFSIGEKVSFSPSAQIEIVGTLTKYNKKTVTVLTEHGEKWNVPPGRLNKIKTLKNKKSHQNNVIQIDTKG